MMKALVNEFKASIKSPETEEKLDLVFYRPLGFLLAKLAWSLRLTPSQLSLLGLIAGLLSAIFFLGPSNGHNLGIASGLLLLSGIFDSSDGQLVRLSGQSTKLGLILDGICDSIVTIAVYLSCAQTNVASYGIGIYFLVFAGLYLHSCQCAILDFYHREYLYFGYGKTENDTYWNPGLADVLKLISQSKGQQERVMNKLRMSWIRKQQWLTSRSDEERRHMRHAILSLSVHERERFMNDYRRENLPLLPYWRLIGVNAHTILHIVFMAMRRFDLYLIGVDLIGLNLIMGGVRYWQRRVDQRFFKRWGPHGSKLSLVAL